MAAAVGDAARGLAGDRPGGRDRASDEGLRPGPERPPFGSAGRLTSTTPSVEAVSETLVVVGAGAVLCLTVAVGVVAHELSHAAVLSLFGVRCDVSIGRGRFGVGRPDASASGALASVTPRETPPDASPWAMRLSAVAPLALAVPFLAVLAGAVPVPLSADGPLLGAWAVGWLACAIPSPQDFSVFWHAERALAERGGDAAGR